MVPRRPPRSAVGLPRRVECAGLTRCKIASRRAWEVSRRRRADPVQVETLTPQQVRRVCTADSVSALASDPPRRAGMVCDMLHPYIPYYNRRAVLTCAASGVAQAVLYPLVSVWYRERLNGSNSRKNTCKALCAVLCRWRYSCIDDAKRAVNACMGLYCSRAKQKPCTLSRYKAKEKPGHC